MNTAAVKELLYKIADDQLILGHRNSEWTGLGPLLEEDIAFSSMAQDKIGHSLTFYELLHEMGEENPDKIAFLRKSRDFKNCQLVELPNTDYAFSLIRHFLYDTAELQRMKLLANSEIDMIRERAAKVKGELVYHTMHANTWLKKLGNGTEESIEKMQVALDQLMPYALGMFEPSVYEEELVKNKIFAGEKILQDLWWNDVRKIINSTKLVLKDISDYPVVFGGRTGEHTNHLQVLLEEMSEVINIDPNAEW
ncbi:MAG: phenylacetate-CoA oxygenase subunit PaaC [Cyclobacteriaceae bacterium]|nr:phenylacetate-CoA oxygenase subunit PaaC [Cyclobacteriaceae bacterium]